MEKIAHFVGDDRSRFDALMQLFLHDEYRICQRAGWAVSICGERHPEWVTPYIPFLLKHLRNPVHPAVVRNTIRLFQFVPIPKRYHAPVVDVCFQYFKDPAAPIAARVYSLTVLSNMAVLYPELKNELRVILEDQLPHAPPAIKSRLKQIKW